MKKGGGSESTIIIGPSKSGLRAPQLRIRPRPCPIPGVRAKIILLIIAKLCALESCLFENVLEHFEHIVDICYKLIELNIESIFFYYT